MGTELIGWLAQHPIVYAMVVGALGAAAADYDSFKKWKSVKEAVAYDWGTASWRWFQGAVVGAVAAVAGMGIGGMQ